MSSSTESFWSEIKSYEERLKKDPASYCFAPLAEVYLRAGLLDDALAVSRAGVARYPGFVAGQMALARACHQKSLVDECRRALEVVTGAVPEHAEAQRLLARLYAEAGRGEEAGRALQTLLEFSPDDISARHELESIQRRFDMVSADDELELIEFTEDDIIEEPESGKEEDLQLVERVKPVVAAVDDPWAGMAVAPEVLAVPEPDAVAGLIPAAEPASFEQAPDIDTVWSVPEQQFTPAAEPVQQDVWAVPEQPPAAAVEPTEQDVRSLPEQQIAATTVAPADTVEGDPLTTPTMAELYISQGFTDKAIAIYRKIVEADANNLEAQSRLAELEQPAAAVEAEQAAAAVAEQAAAQVELPTQGTADRQAKVAVLEGWLENIRRLRTCR